MTTTTIILACSLFSVLAYFIGYVSGFEECRQTYRKCEPEIHAAIRAKAFAEGKIAFFHEAEQARTRRTQA